MFVYAVRNMWAAGGEIKVKCVSIADWIPLEFRVRWVGIVLMVFVAMQYKRMNISSCVVVVFCLMMPALLNLNNPRCPKCVYALFSIWCIFMNIVSASRWIHLDRELQFLSFSSYCLVRHLRTFICIWSKIQLDIFHICVHLGILGQNLIKRGSVV